VLEQRYKKAQYALKAARLVGLKFFTPVMLQRIYRRETFIGLAKYLDQPDNEVKCKIDYVLGKASERDIEELSQSLLNEDKKEIFDLIQRVWFYDCGFHNCYIARTSPENEMCYMQWTLTQQDENSRSKEFISSFPRLENQEMQLEHAYTFKRFRGNKIMPAVMNRLFQIAREKRLKRVITYVEDYNIASLKGCDSVGFKQFEVVRRTKLPLFTRYRISPGNRMITRFEV
jgi:RimJ/RimL family protein N-acetyltransferase